jgi:hypothetical protein
MTMRPFLTPEDNPEDVREHLDGILLDVCEVDFDHDTLVWTATVRDEDYSEVMIGDFETREELVAWVKQLGFNDGDISDA